MAKKMSNLDLCWKNCLSMWAWIVKQIRSGSKETVEELKSLWCKKHGFDTKKTCFFCTYADFVDEGASCKAVCPGALVDPQFSCQGSENSYHYYFHPLKFNNKLRALNRKRLKGK